MSFGLGLRVLGAAVSVVVVAGGLVGCGTGEGGGDVGGEVTTLRVAVQSPPSNLAIGNYTGGEGALFLSIYDTVLGADVKGGIGPGVAEEWQYNDDLTQLTLGIREGQKFSNGEVVDAQAVAASLEVARQAPVTAGNLASVSSVEATDDSTVVISLSRPDASLVPVLADTAGAVGAPAVLTAESSRLDPVGSGAYVLDQDRSTPGSKYVLKKNGSYWNADAYPFETVEVQVIEDPTAAQNAVQAGQLDYATLTSADQARRFAEPKFATGKNLPNAVGALYLADREGVVVPALADVRVRRAINMAFDRDAIAENLNAGANNATEQIVSPIGGAWNEDLEGAYDYNVDEAKRLLAQAGYPDGFKVAMPSTYVSTPFEPAITQALQDIGIEVEWETVPFQDFLTNVFAKKWGMFFMFNAFRTSDSLDINNSLTAIFNPYGTTTPELESLLAEANKSKGESAFAPVNEYLVNQAWFAPITYTTPSYVTSANVDYTPPKVYGQSVLPWAPAR